jgi:hypothetical protein
MHDHATTATLPLISPLTASGACCAGGLFCGCGSGCQCTCADCRCGTRNHSGAPLSRHLAVAVHRQVRRDTWTRRAPLCRAGRGRP